MDIALSAALLPPMSAIAGDQKALAVERPLKLAFGRLGVALFVKRAKEFVDLFDTETGAHLNSGQVGCM